MFNDFPIHIPESMWAQLETTHPLLIFIFIIMGVWFLFKLINMAVWQFVVLAVIGYYGTKYFFNFF